MVDSEPVFKMTPDMATRPIGHVETLDGTVGVVRVDGAEAVLALGSPLYQGDVISTGEEALVGIGLSDGTSFSMSENGSITLDEMVYDAGTEEGSIGLSVTEGVFTFVSGIIAKTDPEAMVINTPVASIGIRGTQLGLDIADGENLTVVMMEEEGGFVGEAVIRNAAGVQVLNTVHMGIQVVGINAAPTMPYAVPVSQLLKTFGGAMKFLPGIGDANDYGLDEASVEQLIEEALAGEPQTEEVLEEEALDEEAAPEEGEAVEEEQPGEFETAAGEAEPEAPVETITVVGEDLTPEEIKPITLDTGVIDTGGLVVDTGGGTGRHIDLTGGGPVTAFNIEPVAFDKTADTDEDTAISGQLTAADYDQDTLTFSLDATQTPDHGTVELGQDGSFTYTPDSDYSGTDTFTYTVDDGQGGTDTATVTVNVTPVADQPTLSVDDATYGAGGTGGEPGTQVLFGGQGEDTLVGGAGSDILFGGQGADVLYGDFETQGEGGGEVAIDISATLADIDTSETLSVTVGGVPEGATLSAGQEIEGVWTLQADDLDGLTMTLPDDYTDNFSLNVEATATETATGETAATSGTINVGYSGGEGGEGGAADVMFGGTGDDTLYGGGGGDVMFGGRGEDKLAGGAGGDVMFGGKGEDELTGGAGGDVMFGGKGEDELTGGAGDDVLIGGKGEDTFIFGTDSGSDNVLDYQKGEALRFEGEGFTEESISVTNNGNNAVITFGGQDVEVTVNNADMANMSYSTTPGPDDSFIVTFDDVE